MNVYIRNEKDKEVFLFGVSVFFLFTLTCSEKLEKKNFLYIIYK